MVRDEWGFSHFFGWGRLATPEPADDLKPHGGSSVLPGCAEELSALHGCLAAHRPAPSAELGSVKPLILITSFYGRKTEDWVILSDTTEGAISPDSNYGTDDPVSQANGMRKEADSERGPANRLQP